MIQMNAKKRESFRLDITPLINIVFLLLIFFMLTSSAVNQGLDVDLPDAETAERINTQEIALSIGKDGEMMLDNNKVTLEELPAKIKALLDESGHDRMIIQGDRNIQFDLFGQVLDKAREAGAVVFLIATDQPEAEGDAT
ncbi:MAG: biopolymer transporter ExbD [Nitrospina sp.]|nr:biopolymer transporter ExbD [Nitrospina sp.]